MPFSRPLFFLTILAATLPLHASDLPDGYRLAQNYHVDSSHSQLRLQLLLDSHVTDDLLTQWWRSGIDLPDSNGVCEELGVKLHPVVIRLLDSTDQIVATRTIPRVLAQLAPCLPFTPSSQPSFALTVDYSLGWGTYFGPVTFFLIPDTDGLGWQTVIADGKPIDIAVTTAYRTAWQVVPSPRTCDIVQVTCATFIDSMEDIHLDRTPDYTVRIQRFHLDDQVWHYSTARRYGYTVDDETDPVRWLKKILAEMASG